MSSNGFLDAVKARHGLATDYRLAKFLGWSPQRIYGYRHRGRELDDEACVEIARALDLPPEYVLAEIAAERAKSPETALYWRKAARLLKAGTAASMLAAVLFLGSFPAQRAHASNMSVLPTIDYAQRRRRLLAAAS